MKRAPKVIELDGKATPCTSLDIDASYWRIEAKTKARKLIMQHNFRQALRAMRDPRCKWPEGPEAAYLEMLARVASNDAVFKGTQEAQWLAFFGDKKTPILDREAWHGPN